MKKFITNLNNHKYEKFAIIASITIIAVILIAVFEPFKEIPFIYNQF